MIHDEVDMPLDGYAHFIFDNKLLLDANMDTLEGLKLSFIEFAKAGINVLPFNYMTISSVAIRDDGEKPDVDILFVISMENETIKITMISRVKQNRPNTVCYISLNKGEVVEYKKLECASYQQIARFLACCMVMIMIINSHEVTRDEVIISEKLNKTRAKHGKPSLRDYIVINLSKEAKEMLDKSGGELTFRKPHWRRGHLRRLHTGKIIPVHACIVNWNGEPVDPKRYIVK